jgi:ADP-ribose pyrophosphatase YjhB (NUDIX family)
MSKKLQARYENIVVNDVVRNVLPKFEQPEEQMVAESKKRKLNILLKEFQGRGGITGGGFGGYSPGLAGMMGANRGTSRDSHPADKNEFPDEDSSHVAKAVLVRNGHVLLLKNERGWDLPGGHLRRGEGAVPALSREVFEETGLSIDVSQLKQINGSTGKIRFYAGSYPHDDIILSDEHTEHKFVKLENVPDMKELSKEYKQMIMKYGTMYESKNRKNLRLVLS